MTRDVLKVITLEEEYKKKTGITPQDISKLRHWMESQPHMPSKYITDLDLILTYHCCNRSAEVSKQILDLHFTLRSLFTNFFKDRLADDNLIAIMRNYLFLPLETRAHDGSAVLYHRLVDYSPKNFVFHEAIRAVLMVLDLWQYQEGTWPGFVIVIDLDRLTLGHLARIDVQTLQQFFYYLQEALLVKLIGLHFLNAPSFMDRLMMLLRPFMKKELMSMLVIHQIGSQTINKFLPLEALPKEAGGQGKTIDKAQADVIKNIQNNKEYFEVENKKRVTESLRPGKPKTITDIFGAGSGIGAAAALLFAREGASLTLADVNINQLNEIGEQICEFGKAPLLLEANVAKDDEAKAIIQKTIELYDKLDVLVNNAGILRFSSILSGNSVKAFDELISVNLRSIVLLTSFAAPHLIATKGCIVNVSSSSSSKTPTLSNLVPYSVSKAGVDHYTRGAALELAQHGVRVNAVSPGPVRTNIMKSTEMAGTKLSSGLPPLGKIANPEELADLIMYISSDKARSITGSIYVCDNGILLT